MKKILLVSANQHRAPYPVYPVGIAYLTARLKQLLPEHDIQVFDVLVDAYETFTEYLQRYQPDYVGISIRNIDDINSCSKESFLGQYKRLIDGTRSCCSGRIIIGGPGYSIYPQALFEYLKPDFAIRGEGEESLCALVRALEDHAGYRGIEGLVYADGAATCVNSRSQHAGDVNVCFDGRLADYYWRQGGMLNIQTKRGCPYRCIYCTYPLIEGAGVRTLNPDKIVDALADLCFNRHIDYVFFTDSVFNICNDYNVELAEKIIARKMNLKWGAYFNFIDLSEKLLQLLKRAGLTHIEFGTESLSDATLQQYGKPFTFAHIQEAAKLCSHLKIDFANFLILCGYGETADSLKETFENSRKLGRTVFFPFIGMRIYPGTRLRELAVAENKICAEDSLLEPVYYIAGAADIGTLKEKARQTGKTWIFPDEDLSGIMEKMRAKNKKGPLWEYLLQ